MPQKTLLLVTVGSPPSAIVNALQEPLTTHLGVSSVVSRMALSSPAYAFNKDRSQYHCNAIMRRLGTVLDEAPQELVMGVTDADLFEPDSPFVFGQADRESKVAVMSLYRLRQGAEGETLRRRVQVEAVHQAGHLIGLSYCEDSRCVMFLPQSPQDIDRKSLGPCNVCRNELNRLNR
ncbi:non-proteolytic archaemetzincin-like protein [Corallococcus exiguus]|uniref:Non-proteolytic archaemetzincin-like protein n=1 Tax=Corallococcus exiguus TaxID=83462 RepID=A0A7Y1X0U5_9BACT|nr:MULTISPECIES: non-proteolytic archaemetzincin-like protein [Corallococcus]NBC45692.1 non-proteolytic archaemetzincin-like protein [Corallococcus exiguus]NNC22036.1 non-proteolytic archaemetzincin-like protein [Corallococcus exiguus]NRD59355.1 non-proteolytic archaemetzincin-like protein [Corallococcus exiguus]NRD68235.1 non-proteolytic archaemetzincin-like protein [Corallococcus exiguus]RKH13071.1 peptidase M54 [Corallococcus sp. CA041A]